MNNHEWNKLLTEIRELRARLNECSADAHRKYLAKIHELKVKIAELKALCQINKP